MKKLFSIFAALLFAGSMMAASITVAHNSSTTTNLDGTNQAALFSASGTALDASVWSFVGEKNDASNNVGLNKDGTTRLYCSNQTTTTAGSALVVTLTGGTIQSVSVNVKSGTTLQVLVGGSAVVADGDLYAVNGTSFSLQNVAAKGAAQVQINSITINYKMDTDVDVDATAVELNKSSLSLEQYREETLVATLTPSNATTVVVWSSSDPSVATVSGGLVKALTLGTTTITATAGEGISASCNVTVGAATVLTCEEAAAKAATLANNKDVYEGGQYVVEGYAISMNTSTGYIWIADDKDAAKGTFEIYLPSNKSEIADVVAGDKIRAHGYISKYNTTYEFLAGCVFEVVADTPTPTIEASKTAIDFGTVDKGTQGPDNNDYLQETFTLTAANLTGNVELTATTNPAGAIFSTNGYRSRVILTPTDGAINATIYAIAATDFVGSYTGQITISSQATPADFESFTVALSIVVVEPTKYYLKNNWDGGEWSWKETTKDGDNYKLENVVFGGSGVNYNTAESDEGATWVAADDFLGDAVKALDTVNLVLDPTAGKITATVVGSYVAPATNTYTAAGSSAALFGTTWDPTVAANDLTLKEGTTFEIVYTDIELAAGTVSFKVCVNHAWTTAYPASDYNLTIPEGGIYTVTITYDSSTNAVSATAEKTGSAVVIPTIKMHGTFDGSWADTEEFTMAADEQTASLVIALAVGDVEFGVKVDGAWTANGATLTREAPSTSLATGSGNMHLTADVAGNYTFTWTYATQTLAVEFPEAPVVVTKYCELPTGHLKDANFGDPNGRILLTIQKEAGTNNIRVAIKNNNDNGNTKTGLNYLWVNAEGATGGVVRYGDGTHAEADVEEISVIIPFDAAKDTYNFINIHWAYSGWDGEWAIDGLTVQASELCEDYIPTAIENNEIIEKAVKFIENGQLFIRKNGKTYNAQGMEVK